eukprot:1834675-Prymnesium_polylepis.1
MVGTTRVWACTGSTVLGLTDTERWGHGDHGARTRCEGTCWVSGHVLASSASSWWSLMFKGCLYVSRPCAYGWEILRRSPALGVGDPGPVVWMQL